MTQSSGDRASRRRTSRKTPVKTEKTTAPATLRAKFRRGTHHRVIRVTGAWGGVTTNFDIQMAVYSEVNQIPDELVYEVDSETHTVKLVPNKADTEKIVIREVEAELVFDLNTARAIRAWLDAKIHEVENADITFEVDEQT